MELIALFIAWKIYEYRYFKGEQFNKLKINLNNYITNCNELNEHVEELKRTYSDFKKPDYGTAEFKDSSRYKFKRKAQVDAKNSDYI